MLQKKIYFFLFMLVFQARVQAQEPVSKFDRTPQPIIPDYSQLSSWAAHPDKKDNADLIPKPLRKETTDLADKVDVFFVHPTIFGEEPKNQYVWNADVLDIAINKEVDESTIKFQATVFNQAGKIYAPRYRQAHLRSFFDPHTVDGDKALDLAYQDVKNAFEFYLKNYNNNRPFILAGHSQGARHLKQLLQELFDGKELQSQLIAAYIVGWGVEKESFKEIPLGTSPEQTGCYLTWRTYSKGIRPSWVKENDVCVNPLTWTADSAYAPYKANLGAILTGFNTMRKYLFDAQVNGPVLWVGKPNLFLGGLFKRDDYHIGDLNLFYLSIRRNAILRARKFLEKYQPKMG